MKRACVIWILSFALILAATTGADTPVQSPFAYLDITSTPSDAAVFLNGNHIGKTPFFYSFEPVGQLIRLQVLREGYLPFDFIVPSDPEAGSVFQLNAWLVPSTTSASLVVHSDPPEALITLNNGHAQKTPWRYNNLAPGTYLVRVAYFGFAPYTGYVDLTAGQTVTLSIPLELLGVAGSLQVSSVPAGASVFINGLSYGRTNKAIGNLAPGLHAVMIQLPGYDDWHGTVEINPRVTSHLTAELSRN